MIIMPSIWQSFVPYHVARSLLDHPEENLLDIEQRFDAVVLFSDVSGFTSLSEALRAVGKRGSEELTNILNSYFAAMIELIHAYGGIIGKFGGDSMTVLFPFKASETRTIALRSIQCALGMQGKMSDYAAIRTQAGEFCLSMKIGVAKGPVYCRSVGDPDLHLEYIIAGKAIDLSAEAEHLAKSGEIIVHEEITRSVNGKVRSEAMGDFSRVDQLKNPVGSSPLPPLADPNPEAVKKLTAYIHPSISQRIEDEQLIFINEHRKATIVFVGFPGFDYETDPKAGTKLQDYIAKITGIVKRYDGYLNKVDMGDKGSKCLIVFGAPIAHEDDAERALRCSWDCKEIPNMLVNIGINTGFVYSGLVGSAERQEYTVMGDSVNLAARLMQTAGPGQIIVAEQTYLLGGKSFIWEDSQRIRVKGKQNEVSVFRLAERQRRGSIRLQEPGYTLPMVGRKTELNRIATQIEEVKQGQGRIIGISAEAGMGKSRLAAEVIRLAREHKLTCFMGECLSHGTTTGYLVWRNILRGIFEIDPNQPYDKQVDKLKHQLHQIDPQLLPRLPLLGSAFNISIPENNLTQSMDAQLRKESLEGLLVSIINKKAMEDSMLLIFEDCHWIDLLSNDLLEAVCRNITGLPVLILVIYRPASIHEIQPRTKRFGHFTEIQLTEFTPEEADQLIQLKIEQLFGRGKKLPEGVTIQIEERAQGNPFFIDEMVNLIRDRGFDPTKIDVLKHIELPESLQGLIISRIDQLAEDAKTTLKVASVIGRSFKGSWLWGIYPQLGTPEQVKKQLEELSRLDITPLDKPEPELEYLFKHIITREVAYDSLADSTRTMLHEATGQFIERQYPKGIEHFLDLLAYHYGLSQNQTKQKEYFRRAGEASQAAYANDTAIDYYQCLLPLLEQNEKPEFMLQMGNIWSLTGNWDQAEAIYQEALNFVIDDDNIIIQGKVRHSLGALYRLRGSYQQAFTWLCKAKEDFEISDNQQELTSTLREIGIVNWRQGNYNEALRYFDQCKNIAEDIDDPKSLYRAIANIGLVQWNQGNFQQSLSSFQNAHAIADSINDRLGISAITGNLGNVYLDLGDYAQALKHYQAYLMLAIELGYQLGVSVAVGNMGNVYFEQGDYNAALACYTFNLQIALELGDQLGVGLALWYLAYVYTETEEFDLAERLLVQACIIARSLDTPYELCDFLYAHANVLSLRKEYLAAYEINQEAIKIARQVEHSEIQFKALVLDVRLAVLLGSKDITGAIDDFEKIIKQWQDDWQDEKEQATVHYEIWRLEKNLESHRKKATQLYRALYQKIPNIEYMQRFEELTGDKLSDPPQLPVLPDIVAKKKIDLDKLFALVDGLIDSLLLEIGS
jgi:adenylate cyclase